MVALSGSWGRLAPSLVAMVQEADRIAPGRSTRSDGSLGDQSHATRSSFHNPSAGYVDALDLTHDPAHGFDAHARARQVAARGDGRIDHIISDRQIWSAVRPSWRRYTGANPHTQHAHFAVRRNSASRTPTAPWWSNQPAPPKPKGFLMGLSEAEQKEALAILRRKGELVMSVIRREGSKGMTSVSLAYGMKRRKIPSQALADIFKYICGQKRSAVLPHIWYDWLEEEV